MPSVFRDTVEYNGNKYAVVDDGQGNISVWLWDKDRRNGNALPDGATKTAVVAARNPSPPPTRVSIGSLATHPTNYAEIFINKDTGELYEFTGR